MLIEGSQKIRESDLVERQSMIERLLSALRTGSHPSTAAAYAGIKPATLRKWIVDGRGLLDVWEHVRDNADDNRVPSAWEMDLMNLAGQVEKAEAEAEQRLTNVVWSAAVNNEDEKAAMALLERRFKGRWARRSEVTGADGGALEVDVEVSGHVELQGMLAGLAEQIEMAEEVVARGVEAGRDAEVVAIGAGSRSVVDAVEVGDDDEDEDDEGAAGA